MTRDELRTLKPGDRLRGPAGWRGVVVEVSAIRVRAGWTRDYDAGPYARWLYSSTHCAFGQSPADINLEPDA